MPGPLNAASAKARLHGLGEIACLDLREHGLYGEGHPFLAVPCPFSRLEFDVGALVPRAGAPVLLVDDGDGIAALAAERLAALGYRDVSWIEGGAPAWAAAGFTLFKGVNLPSKTLGELLEEAWHVPRISVDTLAAWQAEGRDIRLVDGRPAGEYAKMTLPGAVCAPNGELGHRAEDLLPDPHTTVVVHCAGRTRSIVGAASLALAGVPNPVVALENGTQGWALSGRALDYGREAATLVIPGPKALAASRSRADALMKRAAVAHIDLNTLRRLAADPDRTLHVLDVRGAEEFATGSIAGACHAPAVQLVQATDHWIGTRRSRVVLLDDTGLRATVAAVFLAALGYEVAVLRDVDVAARSGFERADPVVAPDLARLRQMSAAQAVKQAAAGDPLLDLRGSLAFRAGHLPGARWSIRPRLPALAPGARIALVGDFGVAALAADTLFARGARDIRLVGGTAEAWRAAGLRLASTPDDPPDATAIDHLFFFHDRHDGNLDAARRYLAWEQGLTRQLDRAERAEYRIGPSPFGV
ncbi:MULTISPECIES: rhodanese-like domain-containing protein [unclassified Aureimonas]|uniref:rhodanese-like domain-containing protein n=1 Tax=unclassified Aureimonas TaxID=2615206 RepID=UPI0006FE537D|nr:MULTISPECIES: rhodanese-like domain-containing protein [unclassified Aureimonas]KQT61873.1 hypothetical protein ASG54_23375 [Aureimonas sp. Leaf460]KQT61917.1 hypothetical protein ASG62_23690 [Aureimonas sp. Leaf427]